ARAGQAKAVDVMIGYTAYEMGLWLQWDDELDQRPCDWAIERMHYFPAPIRAELKDRYTEWFAADRPGTPGMHILSDAFFAMPVTWFAEEASRHNRNVWLYRFDWLVDDRQRAMHAADLCFMFGKQDSAAGHAVIGEARDERGRAKRQRLAEVMMDSVLAFATPGDPHWPAHPRAPH